MQQRADADSERLQQAQSKADAALQQAKQDLDQVQHHAYSSFACRQPVQTDHGKASHAIC